jgi:hypothetical protein
VRASIAIIAVRASKKVVDFSRKNGIYAIFSYSSLKGSCFMIACFILSFAVIVDEMR